MASSRSVWTLLLVLLHSSPCAPFAASFSTARVPLQASRTETPRRAAAVFCLVTADDVEMAVEKAERLWADALAAHEKAEALSSEAESLAESSAKVAEDASAAVDQSPTFKLSMLGDLQSASNDALDANAVLSDAVDAAEEANRLQLVAEAATTDMEATIEKHLIDFPDSELREELE